MKPSNGGTNEISQLKTRDDEKLQQVFLYVTRKCNLQCITCYMNADKGPGKSVPYRALYSLLQQFRRQGANRLTILGGEPLLYRALSEVILSARRMGYAFIRVNTNGMFLPNDITRLDPASIDVFSFSLDGTTPDVNDYIRKGGNFENILSNMRLASDLGYDVRINSTITALNIHQVLDLIEIAERNKASEINFNLVLMKGRAETDRRLTVEARQWMETYDQVLREHHRFSIRAKLPVGFCLVENLRAHKQKAGACLSMAKTRVYVLPSGNIYCCILELGDRARTWGIHKRGAIIKQGHSRTGPDNYPYCNLLGQLTEVVPLCIYYKDRLNYDV